MPSKSPDEHDPVPSIDGDEEWHAIDDPSGTPASKALTPNALKAWLLAALDAIYLQLDAGNDPITEDLELSKGLIVDTDSLVVDDATGRVGIGESTPDVLLHLKGSGAGEDPRIYLESTDGSAKTWNIRNTPANGRLTFGVVGANTPIKVDPGAQENLLRVGQVANDTVSVGNTTTGQGAELLVYGEVTIVQDGGTPGTDEVVIKHDGTDAVIDPATGKVKLQADVEVAGDLEATAVEASEVEADYMTLTDGVSAPVTTSGKARLYVDSADGDLKIKFGDGTVKTIVTDT